MNHNRRVKFYQGEPLRVQYYSLSEKLCDTVGFTKELT